MEHFEVIIDATTGEQTIRPYTPEEIDAVEKAAYDAAVISVRNERNRFLTESDWTQLPDAPVDQTAWGAYRQALRDVTDQDGFPLEVVWPIAPI